MNINMLKNNLEKQIINNYFKSKEELYKYILKSNELGNILTPKDIEELLKLYDELHLQSEIPLSMENYSNKSIDDKNFIVSETDDRILRTTGNSKDFIKEFKNTQNEIMTYKQDGTTNSQEVFNKIAETKKEELTLIPLHEAIRLQMINQELLYKIKFFVTRAQINPYAYKVDIKTGIFYNGETNEVYEVRRNENTNQYEIYVSGEIKYDNTTNIESKSETLQSGKIEEQQHEESINNPKTKKLTPPRNQNNAAFTKIGFLILNIISFIIIAISIIILNK